ncbi:hypothetical protein PUN28_016820 [Cardiocondyla obscurior]|uniref:Uncharacterized protein n=1 Tax=Cardiocondyla obscurior TaxID=286306 RepID=A0AAW2ENW9_9HYME
MPFYQIMQLNDRNATARNDALAFDYYNLIPIRVSLNFDKLANYRASCKRHVHKFRVEFIFAVPVFNGRTAYTDSRKATTRATIPRRYADYYQLLVPHASMEFRSLSLGKTVSVPISPPLYTRTIRPRTLISLGIRNDRTSRVPEEVFETLVAGSTWIGRGTAP